MRSSFTWAWKTFRDNPVFYAGIILTFFASWVILELLVVAGQNLGWIFNLAIHLTYSILFSGLQFGFLKICLDGYAGKKPSYLELFKSIHQGFKFLLAQLTYGVIVLMGVLLLLIPGLYLGTKYAFFGFDIAYNDSSLPSSFRASALLTGKSVGKLAIYLFLLTLFNILGAAMMGLGLLVTVPVSTLTLTSLYQDLKAKK